MISKTLLPLILLAASASAQVSIRHLKSSRLATTEPANIPTAPFVVPLTSKVPRSSRKKALLRELRGGRSTLSRGSTSGTVMGSDDDEEYLTDITVGGQHFKAIVDTGR